MQFSRINPSLVRSILCSYHDKFNNIEAEVCFGLYGGVFDTVKFKYDNEYFRLSSLYNNCSTLFVSGVSSNNVYDNMLKNIFNQSGFQLILTDFNFNVAEPLIDNALYVIDYAKQEDKQYVDLFPYNTDYEKNIKITFTTYKRLRSYTSYKFIDDNQEDYIFDRRQFRGHLYKIFFNKKIFMGTYSGRMCPIKIPKNSITLMTVFNRPEFKLLLSKNNILYKYKARRTGSSLILLKYLG